MELETTLQARGASVVGSESGGVEDGIAAASTRGDKKPCSLRLRRDTEGHQAANTRGLMSDQRSGGMDLLKGRNFAASTRGKEQTNWLLKGSRGSTAARASSSRAIEGSLQVISVSTYTLPRVTIRLVK